jgi:hypothetical protein
MIERDLKEVVGALMRVLDGGTISRAEVEDLAFEATGDLQVALTDAFIKLLDFAFDCESGKTTPDAPTRAGLQRCLDNIVRAATELRELRRERGNVPG